MEEKLHLPDSVPKIGQLLHWRLSPRITDQRVLADKMVFKGNGNLRMLYRSDAGQLHSWDFELPFSQYADLREEHGSDARIDMALMPTAMELELGEAGELELRGGMTAQYLITDQEPVTLIEDAYSPSWELTVQKEDLRPSVVLENRRENVYGEQTISGNANLAADVQFLPDFPRQRRTDEGVEFAYPGQFQMLYYGEDGRLHGGSARWEGKQTIPADESSHVLAVPMMPEAQAITGNGKILVKAEMPVELTTTAEQPISMVTGVELGQRKQPDPNRPSLILRKAGVHRLWDIAKASGSTMEAIAKANGLSGEPAPDQMLLIPVP